MNHVKKIFSTLTIILLLTFAHTYAQDKSLINTSQSPYVKMHNLNMQDVVFTSGFWAERFEVCQQTMTPFMWSILNDEHRSHAFCNFEIAAGCKEGVHSGPPFHDGDFYKWLESAAMIYSTNHDKQLDLLMDSIIVIINKVQRADGYIHTPVNIEQRQHPERKKEFAERLDFETYTLGHLMTTACIHYRATGKKSLLNTAIKATDYLYNFHENLAPELARNAICPSHYMGVVEMYRTTRNPRYLELAKNLVEIRNLVKEGTDHNQDRIPFRKQKTAIGHAVRANYMYAGIADVVAETGDTTLLKPLETIWDDLVQRKMYITGGCGALYDGVSPNGTSYDPQEIQQVHQAYGRDYQLPNITAHNESCANIGNMMWNWRMLQITGNARYADVMEQTLYNSVLSAVSLDGKRFFYTNPLCVNNDVPYTLRWSKNREEYITLCNCCPPNVARTVAEVSNYAYSINDDELWCHLYSGNLLNTTLKDGTKLSLEQTTNYPWEGNVNIKLNKAPKTPLTIHLRIPQWGKGAQIAINSKTVNTKIAPGTYVKIERKWSKGDEISLILPMEAKLIQANPLVEEARNQIAVKRGPVVYCLESPDAKEMSIFDITIPRDIVFTTTKVNIAKSDITALEGEAIITPKTNWDNTLYQEVSNDKKTTKTVRLIPYYAWNNRGASEMTVWIPFAQ